MFVITCVYIERAEEEGERERERKQTLTHSVVSLFRIMCLSQLKKLLPGKSSTVLKLLKQQWAVSACGKSVSLIRQTHPHHSDSLQCAYDMGNTRSRRSIMP